MDNHDSTQNIDYYVILELHRNCTEDDIKKAYKREALRWHPDKHQAENKSKAELRFKLISEAYEVLKDPEARKIYDMYGAEALRNGIPNRPGSNARSASNSHGFSGFGSSHFDFPFGPTFFGPRPAFRFHSPEEIFREFFGSGSSLFEASFSGMPHHVPPHPAHPMFAHHGFPGMMPMMVPPMSAGFPPFGVGGGLGSLPHHGGFATAFSTSTLSPLLSSSSSSSSTSHYTSQPGRQGAGVFTSRQVTTQYINGQKRVHVKTIDANGQVTEEIITEEPNGQRQIQRTTSASIDASPAANFLPGISSSSSSSSVSSNHYHNHVHHGHH